MFTPAAPERRTIIFPHIVSTSVGLAKEETLRDQSLFCYARKSDERGFEPTGGEKTESRRIRRDARPTIYAKGRPFYTADGFLHIQRFGA